MFVFLTLNAQKNDFVGVCTHFDQGWNLKIMDDVADLGCGWIRDGVNWSEVEKVKGKYVLPEKTLNWMTSAKDKNIKVLLILAGGNRLYADNYDKKAFGEFAKFIVSNYSLYINAIEILNEPSNSGFSQFYENGKGTFNGLNSNRNFQSWVEKYVDLLNYTAQIIKNIKPSLPVVGLGSAPPVNLAQIKYGLSEDVDGITDHPYSRNGISLGYKNTLDFIRRDKLVIGDQQGTFYSYIKDYQKRISNKGIWFTELGFSVNAPEMITESNRFDLQAIYLLKSFIEAKALGVTHQFVYEFSDNCRDNTNKECGFGLCQPGRIPKKSFEVMKRFNQETLNLTPQLNMELSFGDGKMDGNYSNDISRRIYKFIDGEREIYYIWTFDEQNYTKKLILKGNYRKIVEIKDCVSNQNIQPTLIINKSQIEMFGFQSFFSPIRVVVTK